MTGFAHYTYNTIEFEMIKTKKKDKIKAIDVINYPLYIIKENNELYTQSEFYEFDHIRIDSRDKYEDTIENYIKFIMNTKYNG